MSDNIILKYFPLLLKSSVITIELTAIAVTVGLIFGLIAALLRISKVRPLKWIGSFYIWLFRGTPLLLQIFFIYYGLPSFFPSLTLPAFAAGVIALIINSGAYTAEIIRAAIQSIDKGQYEAAKSLGMTYGQTMRLIIIPQTYKRLIPPIGNEFIALLKDSSLVSVIGMTELMRAAQLKASATGRDAEIYLSALMIYLALTTIFTAIFNWLEKRMGKYE
ncbi:amino acid ABC transporter permease [Caldicellulosiruptoraceae bacterium PP1]